MNKRKKRYVVFLCVASIPFFMGCSNISNKISVNKNSIVSSVELLNVIDATDYNKYSNSVLDFNLGTVNLGEGNELVEIDLKGIIGVPKSIKDVPILFIISGNNNSLSDKQEKENNTYQGFNYLVDALSKAGFLTVAINTDIKVDEENRAFVVEDKILNSVFEKHLEGLEKAINGENGLYPISLYKKGDLNRLGLIGQSNTGRTIYNIANSQINEGHDKIKGLLSITPSSGITVSSYPDIPTSILIAEHSIDTNIGFDMYNSMEEFPNRNSMAQLTYLIGGNSDKFNDLVKGDTLSETNTNMLAKASLVLNEDTIVDHVTHEEFLTSYSIDFFEHIFGDNVENTIYLSKTATAQKLYQKDVLSRLYVKDKKNLFNGKLSSNLEFNNIKAKEVIESSIPSLDSANNFNEPATNIELNLLQIDWKEPSASFSIPMDKSNSNFSDYTSISIEWALNHANELNLENIEKISLILEDLEGNKSKVILLDELPLNKITGEPILKVIEDKSFSTWSRFTPIAETRIPLDLFEGINLNDINSVSINFEDNCSGSIFIKNIHLKK